MTFWRKLGINNGGGDDNGRGCRDSLFNLPLYPPSLKMKGGINLSSQELTADTSEQVRKFSVEKARRQLTEVSEGEWQRRGEKRALALFKAAAEHVPAYKDFLKKNKINPEKVKSLDDFKKVPCIDKENYLRAYPLKDLCWYGELSMSQIISFSSGSTGQPLFWPRGQILEAETTLEHELFLTSFFELDKKPTLFLNCFSMGMYVAGVITLNSVHRLGRKGYPVTIVTPGIDMEDIIRVIPEINQNFEQVVLAGYPPFVKDILDEGSRAGIRWDKVDVRFLLAGEGYSESWRKYVANIIHDGDPLYDFINLYGSADAGVLAYETPTSIVTRTRLTEDDKGREKLFGCSRLPSLLQYIPEHKYFEQVENELVFSASGGVPLVRYNIHDKGGVVAHKDIVSTIPGLQEYNSELTRDGHFWNLPYVYVFGKSDNTIMLYGLNVYPENIKMALENEKLIKIASGRFTMSTEYNSNMDQYLLINIELLADIEPTQNLSQDVQDAILGSLKKMNREYQKLLNSIGDKALPVVRLHKIGEEDFFNREGKQKWVRS